MEKNELASAYRNAKKNRNLRKSEEIYGEFLCYELLADAVYCVLQAGCDQFGVASLGINNTEQNTKIIRDNVQEQEHNWIFSDEYAKSVKRDGGISYDMCCLNTNIDADTLRYVIKRLLSDSNLHETYAVSLVTSLFSYMSIYNNIYKL